MSNELIDTLKSELKGLSNLIDEKIDKSSEAAKAHSDATVNDLKSEVQGLVEKFNKTQEQLDSIESQGNRKNESTIYKGWAGQVADQIKSDSDFMEKVRSGKGFSIPNLTVKAETVLSSATDLLANSPTTVDVVAAQRGTSNIIFNPDRMFRVRSVIPQSSTSSNKIDYVEENAFSDGTTWLAEGTAADPNSHFDLQRKSVQVEEFGTYVRIPKTMLEDIDGITGYINSRLTSKWGLFEDNLLLNGTNDSTPDHLGITEVASAYVDAIADANVNRFDVLAMAVRQAQVAEYQPRVIMLHPTDYYLMLLSKGTDGHYLMPDSVRLGISLPTIAGVPIVSTTAMTAGTFLVGDPTSSQIYDRNQGSIRLWEQDQDNPIKRLVTITINARLALVNYRPDAWVYGTFSSALLAGTA